ncbi:MAG: DUF4270 family protein [Chryseobacterium sp.]|nr:MAG: DUF4270 family protein [Chryseobacterium sp.]
MMYNMKKAFTILSMVIFGGMLVYNCEPDPDSLGEQLFLEGAANGEEVAYDVTAFNINNNDSIRSDASKLGLATLGAVSDDQFGSQSAAFYTQVRLPAYDPDFGTTPTVDSVVLVIKPTYASDSIKTTTDENYVYPDGSVAAKKVINRYPATKYGRTKSNNGNLTITVNEVTEFLNGYSDIAYSNKVYSTDTQLGSKTFDGYVSSVVITKDSDNSSIFTSEVGFRIPLSPTFFKTKIIDKKGQADLKDVSTFIRYFRGLKISATDPAGYLVQFSPSTVELVMYYKSTDTGATTSTQKKYAFSLGNGNAHIGNYTYNRDNSAVKNANLSTNPVIGDAKLFAQGMGGNSIGIKFPKATIDTLQKLYSKNKAAIISAKIRMYTDPVASTKYPKPSVMTIVQKDLDRKTNPADPKVTTAFTNDLLLLSSTPNFAYIKAYNLDKNPTYYDFTVTQSLKEIVESAKQYDDYKDKYFKVDMGNFISSSTTGALAGYQFTSRPFSLDRAVFKGTISNNIDNDPANPYEIKLRVTYGTK